MKLAIMQPYFFPYIGYFQLMNVVDKWVVFDDIQYIRHGWINRNRILSPNLEKEWQYIIVPTIQHKRDDLIKNIKIDNALEWKRTILGQLSYYKKIRAPYFKEVFEIVETCLSGKTNLLLEINVFSLKTITNYLGINFDYIFSSQCEFDNSEIKNSGDWAFHISKQMNAREYINPIGGIELFDKNKFCIEGIDLKFLKSNDIHYKQSRREFVPWLSIVDVLMFNSPEKIKEMLDDYELE